MIDDPMYDDEEEEVVQSPTTQPASEPAAQPPTEQPAECANCADLKKQMEEYKIGWQRALADYQNLQKETAARRAELVSLSEQQIVEDFIPVYDNFKKAFDAKGTGEWSKEQESWVVGIQYIRKQFADILKKYNVEEIKTVGAKLDTRYHEAAAEEEAEGKESGTIIREIDGGYTMGGRVIKVARVIIAK
jgi:molecular chaperone GrpE